jgi:ribosome-associated protein
MSMRGPDDASEHGPRARGGAAAGQSPGSAGGRAKSLRVTRSLAIPYEEIEWRATTAGGPGGQHANRTATRVEVRFDVGASRTLGPRQRALLLERLGPVVTARAADERSQFQNRELALGRLAERLAGALRVDRARRPTSPTAASRARRLEDKRHRSVTKEGRRRPPEEE